ncbi:PREDICTED: uncharacterized protein LOC105520662 [Colobus angolensis palliatus]|uniref:uncharacterized protein LOC105520662 n=1 Tax=Colobus angolensis palliatus TaxID=336983 RepID=UPI0005F4FC4B|nr:PREDICTED: uncharacterized protein LOC105520662 [Colobus angolensis palliatus]
MKSFYGTTSSARTRKLAKMFRRNCGLDPPVVLPRRSIRLGQRYQECSNRENTESPLVAKVRMRNHWLGIRAEPIGHQLASSAHGRRLRNHILAIDLDKRYKSQAPRNRNLREPRSQRRAKPQGPATEMRAAPPGEWVLETKPEPVGRRSRRCEETAPAQLLCHLAQRSGGLPCPAPPPPGNARLHNWLRLQVPQISYQRAAATEKMEAPRNKLCRDQENSAPRNGGAGTLRVTPAGGVPKDNIRFGATNCVVTEKMSTLGKERFCDREIRCNKCCDRNPPPATPARRCWRKSQQNARCCHPDTDFRTRASDGERTSAEPPRNFLMSSNSESANRKLPAGFTYWCFAWDQQIPETRGTGT